MANRRKTKWLWIFFILIGLLLHSGCRPISKTSLRVFIAGSLVVQFAEIEKAYETLHPDVDVQVEAHGSIQVIRYVTEIHDEIDLVIPADYALIPQLMYHDLVPETGEPYSDWTLQLAGNRLVLAYTSESLYKDEVSSQNWFEIIARPDVRFGLSDPRFDAAGYRALMVVQLAEVYYSDPTIFEKIFLGRFEHPIQVQKDASGYTIHVPELLQTNGSSNIFVRGGSVALLSLLESGNIDYAFEYESVAMQHGLKYVELPPELNLGDPALTDYYKNVEVVLDYQRFSSVTPNFQGETITYGLTIPSNAPNPDEAEGFLAFLLSGDGREIMENNHHPILTSFQVDNPSEIPTLLQSILSK